MLDGQILKDFEQRHVIIILEAMWKMNKFRYQVQVKVYYRICNEAGQSQRLRG